MIPKHLTIWHNPRCSKSRQTLALLQEKGHQPAVRLYLSETPTEEEIVFVRNTLGVTALEMMRKGESVFKELRLAEASEAEQVAAMAAHPILIERPIVMKDDKAAIGSPPEDVLHVL